MFRAWFPFDACILNQGSDMAPELPKPVTPVHVAISISAVGIKASVWTSRASARLALEYWLQFMPLARTALDGLPVSSQVGALLNLAQQGRVIRLIPDECLCIQELPVDNG